jgi:GNAT superfamily N-acetyltransferase
MLDDVLTIRQATPADIPDLLRLRRLMFESMGYADQAQLDAGDAAGREYLCRAMPGGAFCGWLALTAEGKAVGSGGVVIDHHPPGPNNLTGQVGYIMNMSTVPAYRRRGVARRIMQTILAWLEERGIQRVVLHATDQGRPLYEQLGFVDSNEMRLVRCHSDSGT